MHVHKQTPICTLFALSMCVAYPLDTRVDGRGQRLLVQVLQLFPDGNR